MKPKTLDTLQLIPKVQNYMEYMIEVIIKLPRTEKFSIGHEYKRSLYQIMQQVMYLIKEEEQQKAKKLNEIDVELNIQRVLLRIMYKYQWIDTKKYRNSF